MQKFNIDELLKKTNEEIHSYFKNEKPNLLVELLSMTLGDSFANIMEHIYNCVEKKEIIKNDKIIYPCSEMAGTLYILIDLFNYTEKEQKEIFKNKMTIEYPDLIKKLCATAFVTKNTFEETHIVLCKLKKHIEDGTDLKTVNKDFLNFVYLLQAYMNLIMDIFDISVEEVYNSYNCKKDFLFKKFGRVDK